MGETSRERAGDRSLRYPPWLSEALGGELSTWELQALTREGGQAEVWMARSGRARRVARRLHHRPGLAAERDAMLAWNAAVGSAIPAVLAANAAEGWSVVEAVDGTLVAELDPDDLRRPSVYRQLGEIRRRALEIPIPADSMSTQDAMRRRVEATLARIAGDPEAGMTAHAPSLRAFLATDHSRLQRVACHRDLGEHNLILDGEGRLHLIDFGRAAPDFLLVDLVPSRLDVWPGRPDLQRAFEDGFWASLDEDAR